MNRFFQFFFASCLGTAAAMVLLTFVGFMIVGAIAGASAEQKVEVDAKSVLHIKLDQPLPEQTNNLEMNPFDFNTQEILGLNDVLQSIEHAATDKKIEGIFLDLGTGLGGAGLVQTSAIRDALNEFKESDKFIVAYSKYYSQGTYYLASVADRIYCNPMGSVDMHGFAATIPFFKGMLDKIGVKMQVFYAGDFKSATEPYRLTEMSEENRLQLREYIEPVFKSILSEIGESRNLPPTELRSIANGLKIRKAKDAVSFGLVDSLGYLDNALAYMKSEIGLSSSAKLKTVSLEDYANSYSIKKNYKVKDKIAVVYAEGAIYQDDGDKGTIVDNEYIKIIRKLRKDEKIKAIVLRVNSPGGSAIASENIWRELSLAQEAGKPVVVSMGDYAASGGYYISCMADKIFAEPNTLTGSIGVFMMIPNLGELYNDKLGITFDTVKTTDYSVGLNAVFPMDDFEKEYMQSNTNFIYEEFLQRVAEGRNMNRDQVHEVAQGRIWTGTKAASIGLVDELGGLENAIASAAELADLEAYRTTEYPKQLDPMQEFINEITGEKDDDAIRTHVMQKELGSYYPLFKHVRELIKVKGVQARLPIMIDFR